MSGSVAIRDEWPCRACGAAVGEACRVPIAGVDTTGWDHDVRILAPVYADLRDRILPPGQDGAA